MKVAFVTDAPYAKDIRLQRTVEALQGLDNFSICVLSQGFFVNESKIALGDRGQLFPSPIPGGKISRLLWHVQNRLFPMRSYNKRIKWTYETLCSIKPDIIHCINPFALEACIAAAQKMNAKLVYEAYEYWPEYLFELGGRVPFRVAARIWNIEKRSAQFVSCFITVSEPLAQWYEFDSEPQHSFIAYNVNSPDGSKVAPLTKKEKGITLVHSGILVKERNVEVIIKALTLVDNVSLVIQGDGPDKDRLTSLVQHLNISNKITFIDPVPPGELVNSLARYDVGLNLLSSETNQMDGAAPNKIFDYVRAGLGVISGDIAGMRSLNAIQNSVLYVDSLKPESLAAAVKKLQLCEDKLVKMKESSRNNAWHYSRAQQMQKIVELYKCLTER